MRTRLSIPLALASLLAAPLPAQVTLAELAKIARARAERARPLQEKALQPFLSDLSLDYAANRKFLEERFDLVAKLGDGVVPLLLEKLQPKGGGKAARDLAGNCRRVLERLDPSSFVDALAEMLQSHSETARTEAIRLLGHAGTAQAERLLLALVDRSRGDELRVVLAALKRHASPRAASKVAPLLGSPDRRIREDVLAVLTAGKAAHVVDTVLQALSVEKDDRLLPLYIDYFAESVTEHEGAAMALLALLDRQLDWRDTRRTVSILAKVAPKDHDPTIRRLRQLLADEQTSALAVEAAVTLRALGDKQSATRLERRIDDQLRRPQRKREPSLYEQRASLMFALGDYKAAAADYAKIIEYSRSTAMTRKAYIGLSRCEAYRGRWSNLVRTLEASGMTAAEIEALAADDDRLLEALRHEKVQRFLRELARREAPK